MELLPNPANLPVKNAIVHILHTQAYFWIDLGTYRDRIIHCGYTLKLSFEFKNPRTCAPRFIKIISPKREILRSENYLTN